MSDKYDQWKLDDAETSELDFDALWVENYFDTDPLEGLDFEDGENDNNE